MHEAGMPVVVALQAAMTTPAKLLGMENELGILKSGYLADIVAVDENPVSNVRTLESVSFVMKNGVVYKQ